MPLRCCLLVSIGLIVVPARADSPPWSDVRDILESSCLRCHSGEHPEGDFQLATAETLAWGGSRGDVLNGDDLASSRLLSVVEYANPDLAMPPDGKLPDDEIALLRAWILAGAPWPEDESGALAEAFELPESGAIDYAEAAESWWAYRALKRPEVPVVDDPAWNAHPIDAFIRAGLDEAGLTPAPRASDDTLLLHRATYGLTGLPPTPEERAAARPWPQVIDDLLASPQYGEHWGRHWLDLVRYAETNGYERDSTKRNMRRYRDWVIRALNEDLPYDDFLIHQLAGDELLREQPSEIDHRPLLATGYYRLCVWDDEPSDRLQAAADEVADIVDTTAQVFLATTLGCARCHDHKADPVSQRDYFAFTAHFSNITLFGRGAGQHRAPGGGRDIADPPGPGVLTVPQRDALVAGVDARLEPYLASLRESVVASGEDTEPVVLVRDARDENGPATWRYHFGERPDGWHTQGFDDSAWPEGSGAFGSARTPGLIQGTEWTSELITIRTRFRLTEIPSALVLSLIHDEEMAVFVNGVEVHNRHGYRGDYTEMQLEAKALEALVVGSNSVAVSCRNTAGGQSIDIGLRTGWLDGGEADEWRARLRAEGVDRLGEADGARALALLDERVRHVEHPVSAPYPAQHVAEHGGVAPEQYVHLRGSAHAPGDLVDPDVPGVLKHTAGASPTFPEPDENVPTTGRRLALARWMVDDGAFITARVMANRLWQFHFGRGLCRSPGDFGKLGVEPTHAALLDHLACELIDQEWSLKAMHRSIMTSRTYQMSSVGQADALAADPLNDHYWRFDPQRLTAESYRDSVLATTGTLNLAMFGPSVYPPMPQEVLETASRPGQAWGRSSAEDAARRSVYIFVKRSLRPPLMENLDQPDPDLPCPERFPTNVPTQALITLNGAFLHESADRFATRLEAEADTVDDRIALAVELALAREADDDEIARSRAFMQALQDEHGVDEHEALRVLCLGLYNLNEFMWLD